MDDSSQIPPDRLVELVQHDRDSARAPLEQLRAAPTDDRKAALQRLRNAIVDEGVTVGPAVQALAAFLGDEERSVRLTAAKLFVAIARCDPDAAESVVPPLRDRLADDEEFYFVRARSAEALGYVALEHTEAVATPEVVAELRLGLDFDEPEVKQKLAKALEHVAIGDPGRLTHQVAKLADHLADEDELVRYHLCSALAAVGCASPSSLGPAVDPLCERLADGTPQVRGRAAEALGVFGRDADEVVTVPSAAVDTLRSETDTETQFLADRARFALDGWDEGVASGVADDVGSVEGIRESTAEAVEAIRTPAGEECPHCGVGLPVDSPPVCPRCGAPR
ncbi:sister chromatid cohesion protein PDS5 [Haloarcula salinisoli]|uniref:HEAT repeat domain-containing protein n=1 Tax=Haloarcula salinisoli TaxID=2487746 RepID=A0A8J8C911_9EURY|nr:sister chromatid cohesion protein PDS5 [Halomicroarcula salinisoli]MBX0305111.1 HEAT repeat domain-containing protein [Halomicroarcula salinisoli]